MSLPFGSKLAADTFRLAGTRVPLAATRIYQMAFFTGAGVSALVYWVLNRLFPVPGASDRFEEIDLSAVDSQSVGGGRDSYTNEKASAEDIDRAVV